MPPEEEAATGPSLAISLGFLVSGEEWWGWVWEVEGLVGLVVYGVYGL